MRAVYLSAPWLASLLLACSTADTRQITLRIAAHTLAECPPTPTSLVDLSALGDFPASTRTAELALDAAGAPLDFPSETQALSANVRDESFLGYSGRRADSLDFVLWPASTSCAVWRPAANGYPGAQGGQAIGYSPTAGVVLVAGGAAARSASVVGALAFDVGSAAVHVPDALAALIEPRAFASVSDFAGKLLVAGGQDPTRSMRASSTAEVYDPVSQRFGSTLLTLRNERSKHAAVTLSTGEVALIGGEDSSGAPVALNEVIAPETGVSRYVVGLNPPRSSPTAFVLSDRRVFVAGGVLNDGSAPQPVGEAEWLSSDASEEMPLPSLPPARFDRAYIELAGSAVLVVGGCDDRPAASGEDCSACAHGCPPRDPSNPARSLYDAYVIARDGTLQPLPAPPASPRPILLPGSDGNPWLIASASDANGAAIPGTFALYRYDAWSGRFEQRAEALSLGSTQPRIGAVGPDAFVWVADEADGPVLHGARFGTRADFASDVGLVAFRDPEHAERPAHLTPDRLPSACASANAGDCADTLSYDGTLQFGRAASGGSAACVFVADALFADATLELDFRGAVPTIAIGGHFLGDSGDCALDDGGATTSRTLRLTRSDERVRVTLAGLSSECSVTQERLPIGVCASSRGALAVQGLRVTRKPR